MEDNSKKKFWSGYLTGLITTVLLLGLVFGGFWLKEYSAGRGINITAADQSNDRGLLENASVVTKTLLLENYISKYYLREANGEQIEEGIYKGVLQSLQDPYSVYYTKEEYASLQESTSGVYCGIGARVSQDVKTGIITIVQLFENSPAVDAGILPGDIIYQVENEEVTGTDLSEVVAKMKGKEGTSVELTVIRDSEKMDCTVVRKEIEVPTVEHELLEDNIGYIQVTEFDQVTAKQFRDALEDLEKQGQDGLIIDLRNNGGGRLDAVVDMLDRMLPEGTIVSTKDKAGEGETYTSTEEEQFNKPLAVLINGNSASASEVFSGAIQDYGIGKLVGTTSFGKGIVQTIFDLKDGSAIKLTTSEYFTPKGRNIQGTGLEPDVEVELDKDQLKKVTVEKEEDNQLKKAVETVMDEIKASKK